MKVKQQTTLPFALDQAIASLKKQGLALWAEKLTDQLPVICDPVKNGHLRRWWSLLSSLDVFKTDYFNASEAAVCVGLDHELNDQQKRELRSGLEQLMPWRKGPFNVFGTVIDAEWRSDLKWQRLMQSIQPLNGRRVLDVGCGNGYYAMRMCVAGARWVLGIDPSMLAMTQFTAVSQCLRSPLPVTQLPIGAEQLPMNLACFDTVFSMGVLYHRRSPFEHLERLRSMLTRGGELVLETLVIPGGEGEVLVPSERYAQMRNVWLIPSVAELLCWLKRVGFSSVRCVSEADTTLVEQRSTEWMRFHSLAQFLNPQNSRLTVEGYPAPRRAIVTACYQN